MAGKLVDYTLGLYASKTYAARNGLPKSRNELAAHRLVRVCRRPCDKPLTRLRDGNRSAWRARYGISSALGQVEAVRAGAGLGILHSFIARGHDDLVAVSSLPIIHRAYWLVYHESMRPLRRLQAVARFIAEAVEQERAIFR